jgi:hypothetical protein
MALLNSVDAPRKACTLWSTGSPFFTTILWPTTAAATRGTYMQFF